MPNLLYIEASPRKTASASIAAAKTFLARLSERQPDLSVDTLDLWNTELPEFDGAMISAKYAKLAGREMDDAEAAAWRHIGTMIERLKAADRIVIATPMWNFGIPYKLKHWIDLVTQPGFTFTFNPQTGYSPLLTSKPTLIILSSAGDYRDGPSFGRPDLATPYLTAALKFIGLPDTTFVPIGPTIGAADAVAAGRDRAQARLAALAETF